jgi:hypothetical protein
MRSVPSMERFVFRSPSNSFPVACAAGLTLVPLANPAIATIEEAVRRQARICRARITKQRARAFLDPVQSWQLDMVCDGLAAMAPDAALAEIKHCFLDPAYQHRVALLNLRGAALAFRWRRRARASATRRAA